MIVRKIGEEEEEEEIKMGKFDEGLSPLDILVEAVCIIARERTKDAKVMMKNNVENVIEDKKREENLVSRKKRNNLYFSFLNNMPQKEENGIIGGKEDILEEEQLPLPPNKKLSCCNIQEVPNLLEECCLHYPKKPRSASNSTIGRRLSPASCSTSASVESHRHIYHEMHVNIFSNITNAATWKSKYNYIDDDDDDVVDQDWAAADSNKKKKKKKKVKFSDHNDDNSDLNLKKKRVVVNKGKKVKLANDPPTPDLPEEFKQLIVGEMNGTRLQLLIQKRLFDADIKRDQGRLLLPRKQTETKTFLTPNEVKILEGCGNLTVPLIDPRLAQREITLGRWNMSIDKLKHSFVLKSTWNQIVNDHQLRVEDVIQLWSFRVNPNNDENGDDHDVASADDDNGQLHLALVLIKRGDPIPKEDSKEGTTSSNGGSSSGITMSVE